MSYKISEAASAANVPVTTLASWIDRQLIPVARTGSGNHRSLSLKDVDRICIVAELVRVGLPVSEAAHAVRAFSDVRSKDRPKGALFVESDAKTFLVVDGEGASVVKVHDRAEFESTMGKLFSNSYGTVVLNVSETLKRVDTTLGLREGAVATAKPPAAMIFRHGKQMHV